MPRYLIIDGYNAMHKIKEIDDKKDISLETARLYFIKLLQDFMSKKDIFDKISIVFDSKEEAITVRKHSYGAIEALFTTRDKDADTVIVEMLRNASPSDSITVCSDDNYVRNHVRVFGRKGISVSELSEIIMLKKENRRSKIENKGVAHDSINEINEELKKHWGLN